MVSVQLLREIQPKKFKIFSSLLSFWCDKKEKHYDLHKQNALVTRSNLLHKVFKKLKLFVLKGSSEHFTQLILSSLKREIVSLMNLNNVYLSVLMVRKWNHYAWRSSNFIGHIKNDLYKLWKITFEDSQCLVPWSFYIFQLFAL